MIHSVCSIDVPPARHNAALEGIKRTTRCRSPAILSAWVATRVTLDVFSTFPGVDFLPAGTVGPRMALRAKAVKRGVWPPPGGLDHIETIQSEIYLPASFSPVR